MQAHGARLEIAQQRRDLDAVAEIQRRTLEAVRVVADREPWQRERLRELRESPGYADAFESDEPLVSIVIPTLASGALQYEEDWKRRLEQLAAVAAPWMLLTRMPVVETYPSYPARQRAYGYGYQTEYVGWVLHRGELLGAAEACGLELVREYALVAPIGVAGAPENPRHSGFLLRRTGA